MSAPKASPRTVTLATAVDPSRPFVVDGHSTSDTPLIDDRARAEQQLATSLSDRLDAAHDRCMAHGDGSLLVVLQGLDGSGKSGTIKHVGRLLNPVGLEVAAFKEPTAREKRQPFLERIREQVPEPGHVAFFDRSHYEDAIVPRMNGELDDESFVKRLHEIEQFERDLAESGVRVLKCFLNLSYDEQRERFVRRLRRADKQWKFNESDLDTRAMWDRAQASYSEVIGATSFEIAPWHVVASDHKWYRNWVVASLVAETLETMETHYPPFEGDLDAMFDALEVSR
jgi:PPK2 family polyphosphate:nucleotide phosphotransferase